MSFNEQLTPEESEQNYAPLIADLRSSYSQPEEDAQSLARIRQRLINSYSQDTNVLFSSQPETIRKPRRERYNTLNSFEDNLEKLHVRSSSWPRYFNAIAAVVFVTLLVGSMLLVFSHVRQAGPASGPTQPTVPTPIPVICIAPTPRPSPNYPTPEPTPSYPTPTPVPSIGHLHCSTPTPVPTEIPTPTPEPVTPTPVPTGIPTPMPTSTGFSTPTPMPTGIPTPTPLP